MGKKSKTLVLSSRGVGHQDRHLMLDVIKLLPHSKKDCKFEKKDSLTALNEVADLNNCDKCLYFEKKKGKVLYLWASSINNGPSARFLVSGVHTMRDIKLIGNCLRGSRGIISFDQHFDKVPHLKLIKELFTQIFNIPFKHPKSQPFVDRVTTFSYLDGHIWFRNFQILDQGNLDMAEIGPRMVLMPLIILSSSFNGKVIWANYKRGEESAKKVAKRPKKVKVDDDSSEDNEDSDDIDDIEKYLDK